MNSQDLNLLDGKLRRTAYAVTKQHLLELTDTLDQKQVKKLAEGVYGAIADAVEDSLEYMEMFDILKLHSARTRKKSKKKTKR